MHVHENGCKLGRSRHLHGLQPIASHTHLQTCRLKECRRDLLVHFIVLGKQDALATQWGGGGNVVVIGGCNTRQGWLQPCRFVHRSCQCIEQRRGQNGLAQQRHDRPPPQLLPQIILGIRADHDDRWHMRQCAARHQLPYSIHKPQTVDLGHLPVSEDQIERQPGSHRLLDLLNGGGRALTTSGVHFPAVQHHLQHMGGGNLVVNNQCPLEGQPARSSLGRQIRYRQRHVYVEEELAAFTWRAAYFNRTSINSTRRLQMLRPSPVPPYLRVTDASAWMKGLNSWAT